MTERLITWQALQRAGRDLRLACDALDQCVEQMKSNGVPQLPLHGENYLEKLVPQVAKWATKLEGQVKMGVPNYLDGLNSQAERPEVPAESTVAKAVAKGKPKGRKG